MHDDIESIANGDFHRNDRPSRILLGVAIGALVAAVALAGLAITRTTPHAWDPLGEYPQQVTAKLTFYLNETVDVTAHKCSKVEGQTVRTTLTWVPTDSPEVLIRIATGVESFRYKSCGPSPTKDHFSFHNPIPPAVVALVKSGESHWRITGTDTPIDIRGRTGVPRTWTTNTFQILS